MKKPVYLTKYHVEAIKFLQRINNSSWNTVLKDHTLDELKQIGNDLEFTREQIKFKKNQSKSPKRKRIRVKAKRQFSTQRGRINQFRKD